MYEDIGKLIELGFGIWRRNLILCLPYAITTALSMLLLILLVAALALPLGSIPNLESITTPDEAISKIGSVLPELTFALIIFFLLLMLINSFFAVGSVGMAEQALSEGKTSAAVMWSVGRRHFWDMFIASILICLLNLAGIIFLLPGIISVPKGAWRNLSEYPGAIGLIALGALFLIIYILILSLILALVPYSLVVDILGPINAIKASISFFSYNKFDVFVMWLVIIAISLGLQMVASPAAAALSEAARAGVSVIVTTLGVLVVAPLSTVWWTSLYMSRTGKRLYQVGAENAFDEPK
jgi:hypothetical protein